MLDWKNAPPCKWNGQFSIPGRIIRKIAPDKTQAIWQALLRTYSFDINDDLYDPVDKGFNQARNDFYKLNNIYSLNRSNSPSNNLSMALEKHIEIKCNRYASVKVEREDSLWWKWCLEVDIDINFDTGEEIDIS